MHTPALRITGLRKEYPDRGGGGPVVAVDWIDVEVAQGEIVAFLGPNGAGKTTTLDVVLGFIEPTGGTVEVLGTTPRRAVMAGQVSAVLQTGGMLHNLTVGETLTVMAALHKVPHRVDEVVERTGLGGLLKRKVGLCSGGEQQRLRFAVALLPDPKLLVLDEPTASMDAAARREFWDTMRAETHAGRTVIFATHYLEEAQAFAPRTVLIDRGRIRADRPTDELRAMAGDRVVSATLPGSDLAPAVTRLRAVDGVRGVRLEGDRVIVEGSASDAVALLLLAELGASELEVSSPSLESAFFALTEPAATEGAAS